MKKFYLFALSLCLLCSLAKAQDCEDVFISEYVEGWSNNKAIEIYNPTSQAVNLSLYTLSRWANGSSSPAANSQITLSGWLQPYDVKVFVIDKRDPDGTGIENPVWDDLQAVADTFICPIYDINNTMYFNGNDALVLVKDEETVVDIFGKPGEDPGSPTDGGGWNDIPPSHTWIANGGTPWTTNHTMVRKSDVLKGVILPPTAFDTALEYDSLPANTFTSLGWHDCLCNDGVVFQGCTDPTACNYDPEAIEDDGSCNLPDGCTDPEAFNYDSNALCDDGSCVYIGCSDPEACNYDPDVVLDDGSCIYPDPFEDCFGNCLNDSDGDGVCDELEIVGCLDPSACNYDPDVTETAPGTCFFATAIYDCDGNCWQDADGDGICDQQENINGSQYCGENTVWDPISLTCVGIDECPADVNEDGIVGIADLLQFLASFGFICE